MAEDGFASDPNQLFYDQWQQDIAYFDSFVRAQLEEIGQQLWGRAFFLFPKYIITSEEEAAQRVAGSGTVCQCSHRWRLRNRAWSQVISVTLVRYRYLSAEPLIQLHLRAVEPRLIDFTQTLEVPSPDTLRNAVQGLANALSAR